MRCTEIRKCLNGIGNAVYETVGVFMPERCAVCGRELLPGERKICIICLGDIPRTYYGMTCSNPACEKMTGRIKAEGVMPFMFFRKGSPYNRLVYGLKYRQRYDLGRFTGEMMGDLIFGGGEIKEHIDYIVPVPTHPFRRIARGYNQSRMIADGIGKKYGIPVKSGYLKRVRFRSSQTGIRAEDKWDNVSGAFETGYTLGPCSILLVDDVLTTGSTLEACGLAILSKEPYIKIRIATLAYVE